MPLKERPSLPDLAFAVVAFHTPTWFPVFYRFFCEFLPEYIDSLYIVDANATCWKREWLDECRAESKYLSSAGFSNLLVLDCEPEQLQFCTNGHGLGIDLAARAAHQDGHKYLVILE